MTAKLFRTCNIMKNKMKKNVLLNVLNKIVKFYCGLGSHTLNQLKFQPDVPINSVEGERTSISEHVDSQELNS